MNNSKKQKVFTCSNKSWNDNDPSYFRISVTLNIFSFLLLLKYIRFFFFLCLKMQSSHSWVHFEKYVQQFNENSELFLHWMSLSLSGLSYCFLCCCFAVPNCSYSLPNCHSLQTDTLLGKHLTFYLLLPLLTLSRSNSIHGREANTNNSGHVYFPDIFIQLSSRKQMKKTDRHECRATFETASATYRQVLCPLLLKDYVLPSTQITQKDYLHWHY